MAPAAIWAVAGLLLAGLEMLAPGVFLLWVGLGALVAAAATAALDLGAHAQLGCFAAATIVLVGLAALRLRRAARPVDQVNAPAAGLIGRTCRALAFDGVEGRVALGDGTWPARIHAGTPPTPGQALTVVGLDGTTLLVAAKTA